MGSLPVGGHVEGEGQGRGGVGVGVGVVSGSNLKYQYSPLSSIPLPLQTAATLRSWGMCVPSLQGVGMCV